MGQTGAQRARQALRLRTVAAFLLLLLFGLHLAPMAQAHAVTTADCCMAAEGKGCSMHLHRAAQAQQAAHTIAALQPPCPCTAVAPASAGMQDALSLCGSSLRFALAVQRGAYLPSQSRRGVQAAGSADTRGPPALTIVA